MEEKGKKIEIINGKLFSSLVRLRNFYAVGSKATHSKLLLCEWVLNDAFENLLTKKQFHTPVLLTNDDDGYYYCTNVGNRVWLVPYIFQVLFCMAFQV